MSIAEVYNIDRLLAEYKAKRRNHIILVQQQQVNPGILIEIKTIIKAFICYRQHLMDELNIIEDGRKYVVKRKTRSRPSKPPMDLPVEDSPDDKGEPKPSPLKHPIDPPDGEPRPSQYPSDKVSGD